MAEAETMTQAIMLVTLEAAKVMVKEISEATEESTRPTITIRHIVTVVNMGSRMDRPLAKDIYTELKNFEMEVMNIFMTNNYSLGDMEMTPIIKNWLSREDLQFVKTLMKTEQETCKM